ncbi:MAG: BrnT family toxin [Caldilineaceae bacterium]|nr:BrnT family toxin [Caldilineaceae bacterium]
MAIIRIPQPIAFEWDDGNEEKIWVRHGVSATEAEECFFDRDKRLLHDHLHTTDFEARYILLGRTRRSRLLLIVFTVRGDSVRVISARDCTPKERKLYAKRT